MNFKLDPRAKLYLLVLGNFLLFFHVSLKIEVLITFLFILPYFLAGRVKSGMRWIIIYGAMLLCDLFILPMAEGSVLAALISFFSVGLRMIMPCLITGGYAFTTTTVGEMVCALRKMHCPETIIIPFMVVIRFFPTAREDYRHIRDAMALRGIVQGKGAVLRHPAQTLEYILIPMLMNASNVAQDLSVAALTKGIGCAGTHTCLTQIRMKAVDYGYMILCTLPLALYLGGIA